jgi:hypothetical protein
LDFAGTLITGIVLLLNQGLAVVAGALLLLYGVGALAVALVGLMQKRGRPAA